MGVTDKPALGITSQISCDGSIDCLSLVWRVLASILLLVVIVDVPTWADQISGPLPAVITRIEFLGNNVTREIILRQEMSIEEGDPVDMIKIEESRQAIMDLELFKEVSAKLVPDTEGQILQIEVSEKYYTLPIPKLERSADGDLEYGGELRFYNLFGYNQRLILDGAAKELDNGNHGEQYELLYSINRIPGTAFGLDLSATQELLQEHITQTANVQGEYERDTRNLSFIISRWLRTDGRSQGWRGLIGMDFTRNEYDFLSGTSGLVQDEDIVAFRTGTEFTQVNELPFQRRGTEYGAGLRISSPDLGSDNDFQTLELFYRRYKPRGQEPHDNLNYQFRIGLSNGFPNETDAFTLGSSTTLRGYDLNSITGHHYALANLEYLKPWAQHPQIRGVLFADIGNTYYKGEVDLLDLKGSLGLGLRWKIRWLVNVDLRLDAAYAVDIDDYKIYGGTSHTF